MELFRDTIDEVLSGRLAPIAQDRSASSSHTAADMAEASLIDLDAPTTAREMLNVIRAKMFDPHPAARFRDGGRTYSVRVAIAEVAEDD